MQKYQMLLALFEDSSNGETSFVPKMQLLRKIYTQVRMKSNEIEISNKK